MYRHLKKLHDDLNKLFQWPRIWGMEFNAKTCKVSRVVRIDQSMIGTITLVGLS